MIQWFKCLLGFHKPVKWCNGNIICKYCYDVIKLKNGKKSKI